MHDKTVYKSFKPPDEQMLRLDTTIPSNFLKSEHPFSCYLESLKRNTMYIPSAARNPMNSTRHLRNELSEYS